MPCSIGGWQKSFHGVLPDGFVTSGRIEAFCCLARHDGEAAHEGALAVAEC